MSDARPELALTVAFRVLDLALWVAGAAAATFDVWGFCQNMHKELFGRPNPSD